VVANQWEVYPAIRPTGVFLALIDGNGIIEMIGTNPS